MTVTFLQHDGEAHPSFVRLLWFFFFSREIATVRMPNANPQREAEDRR